MDMETKIKNHINLFRFMRKQAEEMYGTYKANVPIVGFVRNGGVMGMAGVPSGDQTDVVLAAGIGSIGYKPEGIIVVHYGYSATRPDNPMTGCEWTVEEMENVYVNDNGLGGLIEEVLVGVYVTNTGHCEMVRAPFRIEGSRFVWGEEDIMVDGEDDASIHGVFPDTMKTIVNNPMSLFGASNVAEDIEDMVRVADPSPTTALFARDLATIAIMMTSNFVPLWNNGKNLFKL